MRRVLVLGGTGWLGSAVARAALADGAQVVCLARGESGDVPAGARLVRADRREPGAYDALAGDWDDVVEIAYDPALVTGALDALAERAQHWTLVSSVSVYARADEPGADESAALVEPRDLTAYPDAKVAAERASTARLGDRLLLARPGLIVGPGDPSDRFGYWPARLRRGGRVLVPTPEGRHVQVIDVDDLAAWLVAAGRDRTTGAVDAVGRPVPLADVLAEVRDAAASDAEVVPVDDATLLAHDVRYWAGPRSLPLWLPAEHTGFALRDGSAYLAAGGTLRPLRDTISRVLADEVARGVDRPRRAGLTPDEERGVLAAVGS
ncbi:NAD-dependent epimerase/dehydratase family protein [Cellulomonas dongxiuzhuiae]|uniref:NAD-dependent epimerase/dehydratase family protein n=1 Tax=Cellulomonas dongxiuzhuiae TaxID=2819979 RepID=A0ABX8GIV3_9CELL|nr:NAD-dependent epimerase/dehydratase family protein [Cellulomonas dongxiuzhuiae]MBO3094825.1 NAD-dependent epimerase/dehydratase family protein [Cellulomonas dongxiuzhuiae]QWC15858.1 NAD-dependent epimerase/dehydratase family protein [Cellulomonas dongxiuzhuiae]